MGVFSGPDTSESGLVLALDAGNNRSYSRNRFLCPGTVGEGAAADNNVSFTFNGTGTFVRMGYGQTVGNYTIKPTDVVYKYVMGETGCLYHGNKITVPQGSYLNFSFDYLVSGATSYPTTDYLANIEDYSGGGLGNAIGIANTTQGIWQRRVMQSGPAATTVTDCNVLLYPGACSSSRLAATGTIYYKNPRAEIINYDPDPYSRGFDSGFTYTTNINLVNDISGNGNNGTFTNTGNAPLYSSTNGGGWIFDGVDDLVAIPNNTALDTQTPSVEVWVKTNATTQNGFWFEKGTVNSQYSLFQESGYIVWRHNIGGITNLVVNPTSSYMNTSSWYHVVATYTSGSRRLYINGVLVGSDSQTGTIATNNGGMSIGAYGGFSGSRGYYYNGSLAVCKVYNRALTASEIQQNFNATRGRFGV